MHCKQWLDKSGLWGRLLIFHVANERRGGIGSVIHFKRLGVLPGVADWLAFDRGRALAIELKDEDGKQRKGQADFERRWKAAGFAYHVVRTLDEFKLIVEAFAMFG